MLRLRTMGMAAATAWFAVGGWAAPSVADAEDAVVPAAPPATGPWGVASGAEWSGDFARFNPLLAEAGVQWLRYFPEWHGLEPKPGEFNWERADAMVADARANNMRMTGVLAYFAEWASADGGHRRFPIKDPGMWRAYVRAVMARYRDDVTHWEVWNEYNSPGFARDGTPERYAELVRIAWEEARAVSPDLRVGMNCANFDVGFFDRAIKAGAAGRFDFIAVHPYENLDMVMRENGEQAYLGMAGTLRAMLKANGQPEDLPLWITETGLQALIAPNAAADARQAEALTKGYVLALAQGFGRVCWFEARGPAYGKGTDHGLIRRDWTPRPALASYRTMIGALGASPEYRGWWTDTEKNVYGFVFAPGVMAAWTAPDRPATLRFDTPVRAIPADGGEEKAVAANEALALGTTPVFIAGLPAAFVAEAAANHGKPFPWGQDYAAAREVVCRLGAVNVDRGIQQVSREQTAVVHGPEASWRRLDFKKPNHVGHYMLFRADPTFAPFGVHELTITAVVRRGGDGRKTGTSILYESMTGYKQPEKGWRDIPEGDDWHTLAWTVKDANFAGAWGYNFRIEAAGSPAEFDVREVRVAKSAPEAEPMDK